MKKIEIKSNFIGNEISIIKTDKKRLTQVLLNIINNALKFTSREGNIQIKIENIKDVYGKITHIKISVSDTGIGIKDEDKPKLFKLFGMLKENNKKKVNTQGIGLGLVIS